jgi:DNA-binding response OmpR family regulator
MKCILIIEDDDNLSRGIAFSFEKDGYHAISANTIAQARRLFAQHPVDLIILDIGLPDGDGVTFCTEIRQASRVPIIMLTARDLETDEVSGLLAGADDYITKPFSLAILRARAQALLRRSAPDAQCFLAFGNYRLDQDKCKLFRENEEIPISTTEFRLLIYLMTNAGQVLSKEQILAALWDNGGSFVDENTLHVNISRLRSKIEDDPKKPKTIKTVHGIGYVWNGGV